MGEVRLDLLLEQERLMKQYKVIRQAREMYRKACDSLAKEEENAEEDWVVEESYNWALMKSFKKEYDDRLTEYTLDYKKYRDRMKETTMKEDTVVKKRLITCEEGRFWNYEKTLYRIDEGTTEEEDDGAKEEEKENVEEDDVLDDSFDSEVSMTSSETEGIKDETSYEKRPEETLSQSDEGTMDVATD